MYTFQEVIQMDFNGKDLDPLDLLIQTIDNRKIYSLKIQNLLKKHNKYRLQSLVNENGTKIECPETIQIPELKTSPVRIEVDPLDKQAEANLKNELKEQIKAMMILRRKMDCPISQKMDKL